MFAQWSHWFKYMGHGVGPGPWSIVLCQQVPTFSSMTFNARETNGLATGFKPSKPILVHSFPIERSTVKCITKITLLGTRKQDWIG